MQDPGDVITTRESYKFVEHACQANFPALRAMIAAGFDMSAPISEGSENLLTEIIHLMMIPRDECSVEIVLPADAKIRVETLGVHGVVRELIAMGIPVNPVHINEQVSPLLPAIFSMNADLIRVLLEGGADPNFLSEEDEETLLDLAGFDYLYEVWNLSVPEDCPPSSEMDAHIADLDRLAQKYGKRRPDYLAHLRNAGAKTWKELRGSSVV